MKKPTQEPRRNKNIFEVVYKKALNFLSYKERTKYELDTALNKYLSRFSLSVREEEDLKRDVLETLGKELVVDDVSYVKDYIFEIVQSGKLVSKRQISKFLHKKGIPIEVINEDLDMYYTAEVEERTVASLCDKKMKGLGIHEKARMIRYLLSKGFSPSVIYTVVDTKFKRY